MILHVRVCRYAIISILLLSIGLIHAESHGEHTPGPAEFSMDEWSAKIRSIVETYWCGGTRLSLPANPALEDAYDDVMVRLSDQIRSVPLKHIRGICVKVRLKYRRYRFGLRPVPLPNFPETPSGLFDFVAEKSSPYEVELVQTAVDDLADKDLTDTFQRYKEKLAVALRTKLFDCKQRGVVLPKCKDRDHTHMAVVLSSEHVLLALLLHLKENLKFLLGLEEALFGGFTV
jgi:hypothetical protein